MKIFRTFCMILIAVLAAVSYGQTALASHCNAAPKLEKPANNSFGASLSPSLVVSASQMGEPGCRVIEIRFQVSETSNFSNIIHEVTLSGNPPALSTKVPDGKLAPMTSYFWRARLKAAFESAPSAGTTLDSNWSAMSNFTTSLQTFGGANCIFPDFANRQPDNGGKLREIEELKLEIWISPFNFGHNCQHESTDWFITDVQPAYNNDDGRDLPVVFSREADAVNTTSIVVPLDILETGKTYWWHARLRAPGGELSRWTWWFSFTMSGEPVEVLCHWQGFQNQLPADNAQGVPLAPELQIELAGQEAAYPACTPRSSQWQIASDAQFAGIVFDSRDDAQNIFSRQVPEGLLQANTRYYWRARMLDAKHYVYSKWSAPTAFYTGITADPNATPTPVPVPVPPPTSASNLCQFDVNFDGVIDDVEFFIAIDDWLSSEIDADLFFRVADAWISQAPVCDGTASAAYAKPCVSAELVQKSRSALFAVTGADVASLRVEVFDLTGKPIYSGEAPEREARWSLRGPDGALVANGVYLYAITTKDAQGNLWRSGIKKLIIMR